MKTNNSIINIRIAALCTGVFLLTAGGFARQHENENAEKKRYKNNQEWKRDTNGIQDYDQKDQMKKDKNGTKDYDRKDQWQRDTNGIEYYDQEDQEWKRDTNGMQDRNGMYNGFDNQTPDTVKGIVQMVDSTGNIYVLTLDTDTGMVKVHTAPGAFLTENNISFEKGDSIKVIGFSARVRGEQILVAQEIEIFTNNVPLRAKDGSPLWKRSQGQQRGRRQ
ncbi:MAG: hypothetical protein GF401_09075 [Chitinivibrionales bacterium]|nr:hypothetical protein [Chitinivibrionales bacterium]